MDVVTLDYRDDVGPDDEMWFTRKKEGRFVTEFPQYWNGEENDGIFFQQQQLP